ncbi:EF-hand domain-containing protein [Bordetella avium]|uniref:EF-hand domain-containing protein n=1 Tax=Bordetella avium TaxID=521 RepID=UPI000E0C288F|nr:EF-hand domain-containing protein [Bordetella avium]RIQ13538.1 EF-hand domain-containing protein [Bordetella avium]RIQ36885.1 EF-hand domain-containing protein [Bordetella avium]RIQ40779.1 EF-hand domain-containing protein [Bordetella avium]RIQ42526.1 EF-hand domain-containing protein [Bordetella avium]RIQ48350.1 EF-hand domain-containing protein [Bordetella avium]
MKKSVIRIAQVAALSLSVLALSAQAQTRAFDPKVYQQMDTNGDGKVSEAKYRNFMEKAFDKLNTSGDGKLTPAQSANVLTEREFALLDKNKKGYVTREEFMTQVMNDFRKQDRNGDGFLSLN